MVFSSLTFFYFFLTLTIIAYYLGRGRSYMNWVLLIASLIYYSWGEPKMVILMVLVAFVAYAGGIAMEEYPQYRKPVFIVTVSLITANLVVFKYLNFFADSIASLFGGESGIIRLTLPIGISFYTFQILSYIIDLYKGQVKVQRNFRDLLLYLCFFPQLIAGPIVRYSTVERELTGRKESFEETVYGVKRFILGLGKKVLLSNGLAKIAEIIYSGNQQVYGTAMYWLAAISYALQIYFDFSGYSDMAIGLGRMFGFHFLENFDHPYLSQSVSEFWRRWHISLSTWFRDYIYIPLGGNRVSLRRWAFNIFIVWSLTGLWHGASWNFIIWGLYYGIILILERLVLGRFISQWPDIIRWIYTSFLVLIGWVIFNLTDFAMMGHALKTMFVWQPSVFIDVIAEDTNILQALVYVPLGIICMLPVKDAISEWWDRELAPMQTEKVFLADLAYLIILVLCIVNMISSNFNPFIYFRF